MAPDQSAASSQVTVADQVLPLAQAYVQRHVEPVWNPTHQQLDELVARMKARGSYESPRIRQMADEINAGVMLLPFSMAGQLAAGDSGDVAEGLRKQVKTLRNRLNLNVYPTPTEAIAGLDRTHDMLSGEQIGRAIGGGA